MAREIPEVVRAAAGLAATVLDEARKLPETLPGIPVRLIGLAMQQAMKVQQQYACLVARGDELFTGLRGEDEPGLATFDDDIEPVIVTPPGFRDSAFDRASAEPTSAEPISDAEVEALPEDPAADAVVAVVDQLAEQVEKGQQSIEELVEASPATADILDELAIDELVDQAPTLEETAPVPVPAAEETAPVPVPAAEDTPPAAPAAEDMATTDADVGPATDTATDQGGSEPSGAQAAGSAPIDGYDNFSIAQLRGRLRGYAPVTVQELVAYEEATRSREPYLRMLRNRLEKLDEQAVESSPLAPRGA